MKKVLSILLIGVLIIGAFLFGSNVHSNDVVINNTSSVEISTNIFENNSTEPINNEDVYYEEPNTSDYVSDEYNNIEMAYPTKVFNRIGRDCDILLEIIDWNIGVPGESFSSVTIRTVDCKGYYLENSYAVEIEAWSDTQLSGSFVNSDYITLWDSRSDYFVPYYIIDDYTLVHGNSKAEKRIIVEDVIDINEYGSIIRTKIDKFGFDNDEYDVYYFVTSLEKLLSFITEETGDGFYNGRGDYLGKENRIIYLAEDVVYE